MDEPVVSLLGHCMGTGIGCPLWPKMVGDACAGRILKGRSIAGVRTGVTMAHSCPVTKQVRV